MRLVGDRARHARHAVHADRLLAVVPRRRAPSHRAQPHRAALREQSRREVLAQPAARGRVRESRRASRSPACPSSRSSAQSCHKALWGRDDLCDDCPACSVLADGRRRERTILDTFDRRRALVRPSHLPGRRHRRHDRVDRRGLPRRHLAPRRRGGAARWRTPSSRSASSNAPRNSPRPTTALEAEAAERERTAVALRESEERYRLLVDGSPDMVLVHRDGDDRLPQPARRRAARAHGRRRRCRTAGARAVALLARPSSTTSRSTRRSRAASSSRPMPVISVPARRWLRRCRAVRRSAGVGRGPGRPVRRARRHRAGAARSARSSAWRSTTRSPTFRTARSSTTGSTSALARARRRGELVVGRLRRPRRLQDHQRHARPHGRRRRAQGGREPPASARARRRHHRAPERRRVHHHRARPRPRRAPRRSHERILDSLKDSLVVDGYELHVSASVGIAVYPLDGLEEIELVRNADTAMYRAKELGRNVYRLYSPEMSESALDRLELEAGLRDRGRPAPVRAALPAADRRAYRSNGWRRGAHPLAASRRRASCRRARSSISPSRPGSWARSATGSCGPRATRPHSGTPPGHDFGRICVNLSAREFVQQDVVANVKAALEAAQPRPVDARARDHRERRDAQHRARASRCSAS